MNKFDKTNIIKINMIRKHMKIFKPLLFYIIDVGDSFKEDIADYDFIKSKDNQNILYVHKAVKYEYKLFLKDGIIINNKFLFCYYKPQDKVSKRYLIFNNIQSMIIGSDINAASHKWQLDIENIIKKRKRVIEKSGQLIILNTKYSIHNKRVFHMMENCFSDHDIIYTVVNTCIKRKDNTELKSMKNIIFRKKVINEKTAILFNETFLNSKSDEEHNKEMVLDRILDRTKRTQKNDNEKLIKYNNEKIRNNWNKVINSIRFNIEEKNKNSTFQTLRKLWKYTSRETFQGTFLKKKYIEEYAILEKSTIKYVINAKEMIEDYKKQLIKLATPIINENTEIANKLKKETNNKEFLNFYYEKCSSEAIDFNKINPYNFNKMYKRWLMQFTVAKTKQMKFNKYEMWLEIFENIWNLIKRTDNIFRTFFLNKKKNVDALDNFRILLISPIGLRLYEEFTYNYIKDWIQFRIDIKMDGNQFGFRQNYSTYNAIEKVKMSFKKENIKILIDLSRAYEHVNREILIDFVEKEKAKCNNNESDIFILNIMLIWLLILKSMCVNFSNEYLVDPKLGVPMGSKFAPQFFNLFLAIILEPFIDKWIRNKDNSLIGFADDIIIDTTINDANNLLFDFEAIMNNNNLKINKNKSEIIYNENLNHNLFNEIIKINKIYGYVLKKNARYLGKYLALEDNGEIITGKDDFDIPKTNLTYINKLTWDIQYEYLLLLIIGKKRYSFVSEISKNLRDKYIKCWRKKVSSMRNIKKISNWEILNFIRFIKIELFNIHNMEIAAVDDNELIEKDKRFIIKDIYDEDGIITKKEIKLDYGRLFVSIIKMIKMSAIRISSKTGKLLFKLVNEILADENKWYDNEDKLIRFSKGEINIIERAIIKEIIKRMFYIEKESFFFMSMMKEFKKLELTTTLFKKKKGDLNLVEALIMNTMALICKDWKIWKVIATILEDKDKFKSMIMGYNKWRAKDLYLDVMRMTKVDSLTKIEKDLDKIIEDDKSWSDNTIACFTNYIENLYERIGERKKLKDNENLKLLKENDFETIDRIKCMNEIIQKIGVKSKEKKLLDNVIKAIKIYDKDKERYAKENMIEIKQNKIIEINVEIKMEVEKLIELANERELLKMNWKKEQDKKRLMKKITLKKIWTLFKSNWEKKIEIKDEWNWKKIEQKDKEVKDELDLLLKKDMEESEESDEDDWGIKKPVGKLNKNKTTAKEMNLSNLDFKFDDDEDFYEKEDTNDMIINYKEERIIELKKWIRIFNEISRDRQYVNENGDIIENNIDKWTEKIFEYKSRLVIKDEKRRDIEDIKMAKDRNNRKITDIIKLRQFAIMK